MKTIVSVIALFLISTLQAQEATIVAPAQTPIGSTIEVRWSGPGHNYDSVYVITPGAADSASGINSASITSGKNPLSLVMPDEPGEYELRYWDNQEKRIAGRAGIAVIDVETALEPPASVQVGEEFFVEWTGPGNRYETIGLFAAGAAATAKSLSSHGILNDKPAKLRAPSNPGAFEVRYYTRQSKRLLASAPLQVADVESSLSAPERADLGSQIEVSWAGPGNNYDLIALFPVEADDNARAVAKTAILSGRNPITLKLPETPGAYELRYVMTTGKRIMARRPLQIGSVETSLSAPERATAQTPIAVTWQGPGNNYDLIALYNADAPEDAAALAKATILNGRNPVTLNLPDAQGKFELRYRTAQSKQTLARRAIAIEPAGRLAVVFEREGELTSTPGVGAVAVILDASGSMLQREDGVRRIEIARQVLTELVREHLDESRQFSLRVFGNREPDKCRTDLEIPLGPLDRQDAAARIAAVQAMNLARTPIADSLAKIPMDLASADGPKSVIVITDGEETCNGDPAQVIRDLRARGLDVQVSIVGFAIDDAALKQDFETWAQLGGGSYFDARSADELTRSLRTVLSGPFRVLDTSGEERGRGVIGGADLVLPAGTYRVETVAPSPRTIENVVVESGEVTRVAF